MKFQVKTLGCRTNIAESEWLIEKLLKRGFRQVPEDFDLLIVNSCTVTASADRKTRQLIRSLKRRKPAASVIVTGCGARRQDGFYREMAEVDLVMTGIEEVEAYIREHYQTSSPVLSPIDLAGQLRSRATVKIQEGCDSFCSYCIIPLVRGRERSRPEAEILSEIRTKSAAGWREIVLTGTHLGHFGRDLESKTSLNQLISLILAENEQIRLRLSSIEPEMPDDSLYEIFREPRVCPHLHLCLQSGSDAILEAMGRQYDTARFAEISNQVRQYRPDLALTTDVIVGFPGETEELFQETVDFITSQKFAKLHVFPFSERPQTRARYVDNKLPSQVLKERSQRLNQLSVKLEHTYARQFIGTVRPVIFETATRGLTDNYIMVETTTPQPPRQSRLVKLTESKDRLNLRGEVIN